MGGGSRYSVPPPCNVNTSTISNIAQVDGLQNDDNLSSSDEDISESDCSMTDCDTDDEIDPDTTPIALTPVSKPNKGKLKVLQASSLPLVTLMNVRSLYNKPENFKKFLNELGIEVAIISESWEREDITLEKLLKTKYKVHSYKREKTKAKKQPSGGIGGHKKHLLLV